MSRPRSISLHEARTAWHALVRRLDRRPFGWEFAEALGTSERTAWRYLEHLDLVADRCPVCKGTGLVRRDHRPIGRPRASGDPARIDAGGDNAWQTNWKG